MNLSEFNNIFEGSKLLGDKIVISSHIVEVLRCIKEHYHFNMLKEIIAVDNKEQGVELIYKLYSVKDEEDILISIIVNDEIETVSHLFDSAIADEKEIYDLFGINFIGNSELKRLYMPDSWSGHPLKKDYEEKDGRLSWND